MNDTAGQRTLMMKARKIFSGISIGLTLGLLFDGILLVNSSGWLMAFIVPVVLLPILGLVGGLLVGRNGLTPALPWHASVSLSLLLWPAAIFGPIKFQEWRFRRFAENLPAYQGADRRIQSLEVMGGDSPPNVRVAFETKHVGIPEMVKFYRDHLVEHGWAELEPQANYVQDGWYKFRKGQYTVSIIGYEGGKWGGMQCVAVSRDYNTFFYR